MTDKVLYECPVCGGLCLTSVEVGAMCDCKRKNFKAPEMVQVWPAPSGWISVEEDGPPKHDTEGLLVWVNDPIVPHWTTDEWRGRWYWATMGGYAHMITHWQPGPSAPEEASHD